MTQTTTKKTLWTVTKVAPAGGGSATVQGGGVGSRDAVVLEGGGKFEFESNTGNRKWIGIRWTRFWEEGGAGIYSGGDQIG